MISLDVNKKEALKNIKYLNRIKNELKTVSKLNPLDLIEQLELLMQEPNLTSNKVNKYLGVRLNQSQVENLFDAQYDEFYPSKKQAKEFSLKITNLVDLNQEEISIIESRFIHVWQVPRTNKVPTFDSLINLISLYANSKKESELVQKLIKIPNRKVA